MAPDLRPDLDPKWVLPSGYADWPGNNGVDGVETSIDLQPGTEVVRWGAEGGRYVGHKDCTFSQCSLPYDESQIPFFRYRVLKPLRCFEGKIAPWFDQEGGGIQYRFGRAVRELVAEGFLERVK